MTTQAERAQDYYNRYKPGAVDAAHQYLFSRTPTDLQAAVSALLDADLNPPPDPSVAIVHNGATINVGMWDASTVPGVATVAGSLLTRVTANPVATKAIVANGGAVPVHSLADANLPGSPGTATVAAGVFTKVNLTV